VGTGHEIPVYNVWRHWQHAMTFKDGQFMWHLLVLTPTEV